MALRQALASERELLVSLFGDDWPAEPGARAGSGEMPDTAALLDRVFESICRPLKARAPVQLACWTFASLQGWSNSSEDVLSQTARM